MVISFSVPEARDQLLEKGRVYTFRWKRRSFFDKGKGTVEHTWANAKRHGKRIANVNIEEVRSIRVEEEELDPFYEESGFKTALAWWTKIYDMANPYIISDRGWLYLVTIRPD